MKRKINYLFVIDYISDVIVIFVSYVLAMFIRYEIMSSQPGLKTLSLPYLLIAFIYSIVISSIFGYMHSSDRFYYRSKNNGAYNMFVVNAVGCLCLLSFFYIIGLMYFSRGSLLIFWCISSAFLLLKKDVVFPRLLKNKGNGSFERNVLLVGDGNLARDYFSEVKEDSYIWLNVVGFVGDKDQLNDNNNNVLERLGGYKDIRSIIENMDINEIVFATYDESITDIDRLFDFIKKKNISISLVPNLSKLISINAPMHGIGIISTIDLGDSSKGIFGSVSGLGMILSISLLVITLIFNIFDIGFIQEYKIYGTYKSILFAILGFCLFSILFSRIREGKWMVTRLAVISWVSCVAIATVYELLDSVEKVLIHDLRMDVIVITITIIILWIVYSIIRSIQNDSSIFLL